MEKRATVGLILLAAGASTRLGRPKQLLDYHGKPLLRHAAETALGSCCRPVIIVLGCDADLCGASLEGLVVETIVNPQWKEGLASSIRAGLGALVAADPAIGAAIFCVADQPHITAAMLDSLIEPHETNGAAMVAAEYAGQPGVPALFAAALFPQLNALQGDEGARHLLRRHPEAVTRVPFPEGQVDVDTEADYERLRKRE